MSLLMLAALAVQAAAELAPSALPELDARHWYNNPVFQVVDQRDVILVLFREEDRELPRLLRRLSIVARRPDVVVIGLTPDSRGAVERLIEQHHVRFTLGARSRSAGEFLRERSPRLIRVRRSAGVGEIQPLDAEALVREYAQYSGASGGASPATLREPWELLTLIGAPTIPSLQRAAAVNRLYSTVSPSEFLALADALLDEQSDPDVRNRLEFYALKARGVDVDDQMLAPSAAYLREYQAAADDPAWAAVRTFEQSVGNRDAPQLTADYWDHLSDAPADALIRWLVAGHLPRVARNGEVREALFEMLAAEPDFAVRGMLTSALAQTCTIGDLDAAARLEKLAESEPNLYHVRPWMQATARYLRTGETAPAAGADAAGDAP